VKYLPLLFANLKRKKIRTTLTIGSFAVAMFLFGLLAAVRAGFRQGVEVAGADRLVVVGRTGLIQPLPLPYMERIRRLPGVKDVAHVTWFGGVYQDPKNFFAQFVIEPEDWRRLYPEYAVPDAQWQDFLADRQGVVIGQKLAQRFGWKIGDRVPLKAPGYLGGTAWEFNVRAVYRGRVRQLPATKAEVLKHWSRLYAGAPEHYTRPYRSELLFNEDGVGYWLVFRTDSLPQFKREIRKGMAVDLFLIRLGATNEGAKSEPLLLVESYQKPQ